MAKNFKNLLEKMSPSARARVESGAKEMIRDMALDELREARKLTQERLAEILGVKQSAVSKMERRADMYISTLMAVVEAMGGKLSIEAVFPEGKVPIRQFRKLAKSA